MPAKEFWHDPLTRLITDINRTTNSEPIDREHIRAVTRDFRDDPNLTKEQRIVLSEGLYLYFQCLRLRRVLERAEPGTKEHRTSLNSAARIFAQLRKSMSIKPFAESHRRRSVEGQRAMRIPPTRPRASVGVGAPESDGETA